MMLWTYVAAFKIKKETKRRLRKGFVVNMNRFMEFNKTMRVTSFSTPANNSSNEQNTETVQTNYNLVGFCAVLYKTTT